MFANNEFPFGRVSLRQQAAVARYASDMVRKIPAGYGRVQQGYAVSTRKGYGRTRGRKFTPGVDRRAGLYGRFTGTQTMMKEKKFHTVTQTTNFGNTTGLLTNMNIIPVGTSGSTRIGRKIQVKSIYLHAKLQFHDTGSVGGAQVAYLWVVLDKQTNGAQMAAGDVWTTSAPEQAMIKMANSERFKIVKKWVVEGNPTAGVSGLWGSTNKIISWYHKCNTLIEYDGAIGTTGDVAEQKSNSYSLWAGSSCENALQVQFDGVFRLRYYD